jgi:hypothetical protein
MNNDDLTLTDLADQVMHWSYNGKKPEWGEELLRLANLHGLEEEVRDKTVATLGKFVSDHKAKWDAGQKKERWRKRGVILGVTHSGRPITETLSVRGDDGKRQLPLWTQCSPRQYMEAVSREQRIVTGRDASNAIRWEIVNAMQAEPALLDLPTMLDVCKALGIDPDLVGLEETA